MRRISETLTEIQNFLNGDDLSDRPLLRELAAEYAAACREAGRDLDRCRSFFDAGTPLEAYRFNRSLTPTLAERCRKLYFERRDEWLDLCRSYNIELPPEPDKELLKKLESESELLKACSIDELLKLWRGIARTGSPEEKMRVLRQLVDASDSQRQWKENLLVIEKNWLTALMHEAEEAFRHNDAEKLWTIYDKCTDKELLTPAKESDFQSYMPLMQQYRKQQFEQKQERLLRAVADACALMDHKKLAPLLEKWDALCQSPLYTPNDLWIMQIDKARSFLNDRRHSESLQEEFERCKALLAQQLADGTPFPEIARTYTRLQQTELPIPQVLSEQFANRDALYATESHHRHTRSCVYGFLGVIVLFGIGGFLYYYLTTRHEISRIEETWLAQLDKDPGTVLASFDDVAKSKPPRIAASARLVALRARAEERLKEREREHKIIADKLNEAARLSNDPEAIDRVKLAALLAYVAEHQDDAAPSDLRKAGELQELVDKTFCSRCDELGTKLDQLERQIESRPAAAELEQNWQQLKFHVEALRTDGVSKQFHARKELLRSKSRQLREMLDAYNEALRMHARLYNPGSMQGFFRDLAETRKKFPELWAEFGDLAAAQEHQLAVLTQTKELYLNHKALPANLLTPADNAILPLLSDLLGLLPLSDTIIADTRETAKQNARQCSNLHVLELPVRNNAPVTCYLKSNKFSFERSGGALLGGSLKSLSFRLLLPQDMEKTVLFTIRKDQDGYYLSPAAGKHLYSKMPETDFGPLKYNQMLDLERCGAPIAPLAAFWLELSRKLELVNTLDKLDTLLLREMGEMQARNLSPQLKKLLLHELIRMFDANCRLNAELMAPMFRALRIEQDFDWLTPRVPDPVQQQTAADDVATFCRLLPRVSATKALFQTAAAQPLEPAGFLFRDQGKLKLKLLDNAKGLPLLVVANGGVRPLDPSLNGTALRSLPQPLRDHTFNGQLIFTMTPLRISDAELENALLQPQLLPRQEKTDHGK